METLQIDKKKVVLWSLYDFANSVAYIVFFLYYSQWLTVEIGISDLWFNIVFVFASILLLLVAPIAAIIADKKNIRLPGLRICTLFAVLSFFITGVIATFTPEYYILSIAAFTIATFFYMFSFTYYHPLLNEVCSQDKQGLASGWGQFGNWSGQIFGLLITLPIAAGAISLFGKSYRAETLLVASVLFFVFALPTLLFFKENAKPRQVKVKIMDEYKNIFRSFSKLVLLPGMGIYFLAYFFFNDAIMTASTNFPIYLQNVFGVSDQTKSILLMGIIVTSAIGAPISGWLADRFGLKNVFLGVLVGWIIIFPVLAMAPNFMFFVYVTMIMGFWFGASFTITRAYLLRITPQTMLNQSFTYYTLFERFATFIGPISWGIIVVSLPKVNHINYRAAAMLMGVFVLVGLLFALKLPKTS